MKLPATTRRDWATGGDPGPIRRFRSSQRRPGFGRPTAGNLPVMGSERASGERSLVRDLTATREVTRPDPALAPAPETADSGRSAIGVGTVLDHRYRLDDPAGRGGSATVYRATDTVLGRRVAVKVFHPDPAGAEVTERRAREMRLAAAVSDPHLLAVYDAHLGRADGPDEPCYLVTEFVDGPNLADLLAPGGLGPPDVRRIGGDIARALAALHEHGLVHRDVKPSNVLLTTAHQAKLADLGIARELDGHPVTRDGAVPGTAPYLSPEQAEGKPVGPSSDVYSLGLVLLECLTGRREFPGAALESALARLLRDPAIPPTLPEPWPALLASMTDRDPGRRPPARVVAAVLDSAPDVGAEPGAAAPSPRRTLATAPPADPAAPAARRSRHRPVWLLAAVAASVIGIGTAVAVSSGDPETARPPGPATTAPSPAPTSPVPATVTVTTMPAETPTSSDSPVGSPAPVTTAPQAPATTAGAGSDPAAGGEPAGPVSQQPAAGGNGAGAAGGQGAATNGNGGGNGSGNGQGSNGNGNGAGNANGNAGAGNSNGGGNGRGRNGN